MRRKLLGRPILAVFIYFIIGSLWIFFSDNLLAIYSSHQDFYMKAQLYKGWFYIACTSGILYFVLSLQLNYRRQWEELYRDLFHHSPDAVLVVGADGTVLDANETAHRLFGKGSADIGGSGIQSLFPSAAESFGAWREENVPAEDGVSTREEEAVGQSGRRFLAGIRIKKVRYQGKAALLLTIEDLSERRMKEIRLRESEALYRSQFLLGNIGIVILDRGKGFIQANRRFCEMLGYAEEELTGIRWDGITEPADLSLEEERFGSMIRGETDSFELDKRFQCKDGKQLPVHLTMSCSRGKEGLPDFVIASVQDISEIRKAQEEILALNQDLENRVRQRTAELQNANQDLEAFSHSVSHDVRAPLRAIAGYTRMLKDSLIQDCGERPGELFGKLESGMRQMEEMISGLEILSRLNQRKILALKTDLTAIAVAVAAELRDSEPARRVEFVIKEGCSAECDPAMARILLQNLMSNSWKYSAKHETARIEFGETDWDGRPAWFVKDDGAGFNPTYASRLFLPFQRLHQKAEFDGLGIGLATVARIVRMHRGRIRAEGAEEKGAVFTFTLG